MDEMKILAVTTEKEKKERLLCQYFLSFREKFLLRKRHPCFSDRRKSARAKARAHEEDPCYFALTQFNGCFFFHSAPRCRASRRFQGGECADDISMVYIKTVFVFSIRLIRTVTGNTAGGCVLGFVRKQGMRRRMYTRVCTYEHVGVNQCCCLDSRLWRLRAKVASVYRRCLKIFHSPRRHSADRVSHSNVYLSYRYDAEKRDTKRRSSCPLLIRRATAIVLYSSSYYYSV